jgi:hypothetical protein
MYQLKEVVEVVSPWEFLLWPHNKELGPEGSTYETKYVYVSVRVIECRMKYKIC